MTTYTPTIGIEVHAELKTKSKMFCGCKNDPHASEPNQNICPVCLAHPGTLPTVNKEAVKFLMMVGRAIGGTLADYSEFDRKNYFYPDIPKAYQISQYKFPFVVGGEIAGVKIRRVHLEEDTARSSHNSNGTSLVDFNRAGVPLMELVTEPVIHDAITAGKFARELQLLLRSIGVSDANMEKGEMRVEANISISDTEELGTLSEVKNLNSVKVMEAAIAYEIDRQSKVLDSGEKLVQETRGWNEAKAKTYAQRTKETADDYRYFPDPDIPKFDRREVAEFSDSRIDEIVPDTPLVKREKYYNLGLNEDQTEVIISSLERDRFFTSALTHYKGSEVKKLANYFVSDVLGIVEESDKTLADAKPETFAQIIELATNASITSRVAKDLIAECIFTDIDVLRLAEERNLIQSDSADDLQPIITAILAENKSVVEEYKAGNEKVLKFLVGQGMKATKGSANPQLLEKLLEAEISS